MNEATLNYVRQHADDDVSLLALRGSKDPQVDLPLALQQIQGRQTARKKLPSWASQDGIQYPVHLSMEQCSSEHTARYKAALCRRLLENRELTNRKSEIANRKSQIVNRKLLDLTGGFGVDFVFMSETFDEATYVERDPHLFTVASANLALLCPKAKALCADGTEVLHETEHVTLIFLDPARRDDHGARTYGIANCTPNVLELRDELLSKADYVLLKLSPMLDWRKAVNDLGSEYVSEVHIVSVDNECKELLLLLSKDHLQPLTLHCVNNDQHFSPHAIPTIPVPPIAPISSPTTLLEPNASIMKAGCFAELAHHFGVAPVAPNSHLFLSAGPVPDFPGRSFRIVAIATMNKRDLKTVLQGLTHANITTRNFPLTAVELRRKLKLADGGDTYLFATTQADGTHILLVCKKN